MFLSVNNAVIIVICCNFRIGKAKPFEILKRDETGKFIKMFMDIGNKGCNVDFDVASQFVCQLYAQNNTTDVNEARYKKLMNMTGKPDQVSMD